MAAYYVWSGATGSGNGSSWANAYTTLSVALTGKAAGDTFHLAHDHSESTAAAITLAAVGTVANPGKVVCVNRAGSVPPVSADRRATAQVATTTTGASHININGFVHYDGVIFIAGNGGSTVAHIIIPAATAGISQRFDNCSLRLGNTAATSRIYAGNSGVNGGTYIELNSTTVSFSAAGQQIDIGAVVRWRNTPAALLGAAVPVVLFNQNTVRGGNVECVGVDFSAAGASTTLVSATIGAEGVSYRFVDCKLNAAVIKSLAPASHGSTEVDFFRSGAAGNYAVFRHRISGALNEETTIVRTGGAADGATSVAWKIDTTVNCTYSLPFECPPIVFWNDTVGTPVTATVEGVWGGGVVPNDDECWVELEYLGSAASPQGSFVNDGKADLLTAAAPQTASAAAWGGSTTKFKLSATFIAQQKGRVYARVKCAKPGTTFYVDPMVVLS